MPMHVHCAAGWPRTVVAISAALALLCVVLLRPPATDERAQVHGAVAALGQAVGVIERSYATADLAPHDGHLALPTSARYCAHLRVNLPDTGRARLRCQLRSLEGAGGTLTLQRSPAGAWHCSAEGVEKALLPAHCRHHVQAAFPIIGKSAQSHAEKRVFTNP